MTDSLTAWLESNGLGELAGLFERERIMLDMLPRLQDSHLKELGLPLGDRLRALAAIEALTSAVPVAPPSPEPSESIASRGEGERRQLTVLFCDMVGFTEVANRLDPEVLQQIIRSYEDACAVCVTRYDGYVFQRLGDGIVAVFGYPLAHEGEAAEDVAALKACLAVWDASGGKVWSPYAKALVAEGMAMLGDIEGALQLIDEQIAQVERPGWEERLCYAEILRLKGWMLWLKSDLAVAEQNYLTSLDWAGEQQAKSWELRTATSLAKLWQSQGKCREALNLLKPIYTWFTEGFDTKDLKQAKSLLAELK